MYNIALSLVVDTRLDIQCNSMVHHGGDSRHTVKECLEFSIEIFPSQMSESDGVLHLPLPQHAGQCRVVRDVVQGGGGDHQPDGGCLCHLARDNYGTSHQRPHLPLRVYHCVPLQVLKTIKTKNQHNRKISEGKRRNGFKRGAGE